MKKRIALILPTSPEGGGAHQYAVLVVKCLMERAGNDYDLVLMWGSKFWRTWCKEKNIECLKLPLPAVSVREKNLNIKCPRIAQLYYTFFTPIGKRLRREKIDILFVVQQYKFIPNYRVKIVSPVHDLMHRYEADFPEVKDSFYDRELCMKSLAKYGACILVDSNLGKKQFEESYMKREADKSRIVSLPFVVPEHVWNAAEEYIEVPDKYVFYPAQFWKHKNHINLVKAIEILRKSIKDIHLVFVGSEKNNCDEIKRYIVENDLEHHITIMGFVSDENITYLYKHAIGMIMPSYFGPTNIPPLEAMALGCPVAVSGKYAMPEQVGNAGLLFDPDSPDEIAECIKKLWTDEKLREKMKELGYKRMQKWTKREFAEKLYEILNAI